MKRGQQDSQPLRTETDETSDPNSVSVDLSAEDLETLLKLRDAGLVDLDGVEIPSQNPQLLDWTYEEFERHMVSVQKLRAVTTQGRPSTAKNRVRYVRFLEDHDIVPVDMRPPDEETWIEHVHYRREEEGATGSALNQYRKALKSLLKFLGVDEWDSLREPFDELEPHWTLPPEEIVPRFWLEELHEDPYLAATYGHIFHFGFNTGVRPPSEIVALDVDDVDFDARRVTITEVKKGGKKRDLDNVEGFVLDGSNAKSLKNYLENWRPKVDDGSSNAFFLNTEGERFNVRALGHSLSELGKEIWPQFQPYTMRRWFATTFLVDSGFNVYVTAERIGDTVSTVESRYLDKAKVREELRGKYRKRRLYAPHEENS